MCRYYELHKIVVICFYRKLNDKERNLSCQLIRIVETQRPQKSISFNAFFKAEDDRDKAIAYCDEVRAKEDEHKAYIESLGDLPVYDYVRTNAVRADVSSYYRLSDSSYKLISGYSLEDMLKMNDEQLLEIATDVQKASTKYYGDAKPFIQIERETFDILLTFGSEKKYYSVANAATPYSFHDLSTTAKEVSENNSNIWAKKDLLDDLLNVSVSELRESIEKAIERINARKDD